MFQGIIAEMFDQQTPKTSSHAPTSDFGNCRQRFKLVVTFMACDSENMEIFHIFWRQTIDGDMMWLSISCKEVFLFDYVEGVNGGTFRLR